MTTATTTSRRSRRSTGRRLGISAAAVGAAAAVAGLGTFGTFTSSTTATETVNTGTVSLVIGTAGSAANRLSVTAGAVVPGDTISRAVTLTNGGQAPDQSLGSVVLNTTATTSSILDTGTNGLTMTVLACSVPWTEAGTSPAFTYTCSGTATTVVATRAVLGTGLPIAVPSLLAPGGTANLVVQLALPVAADNAYQAKTSTIQFEFVGTQRSGTAR
ncbi:hypothetical protein [Klenkia taihuensis]|uniref:Camelysin metallo-endopeptidase n=1 Tax=Klenkia taihuensis TaxID=1225127 RepID=A0A1I1H573_9ACTN|nr:hypothetical protein [Klenkia taihuensis]GHE09391.1 hypothetical protein GCM10011381_13990 [Klenkia taihuensis]SFC18961.1 hypothetical protein SAMN05661030_0336 [Klenkia taihuensis]